MIAAAAAALGVTTSAFGASGPVHSQVAPPGPTGCANGLTETDAYPSAALPATMVFNPVDRVVEFRLVAPTQTTRVTLRALLLSGRRGDALTAGEYDCTVPGRTMYDGFPAKPDLIGAQIRSHGRVRLRIVFAMVNANGRETTLRRTVTVSRLATASPGQPDVNQRARRRSADALAA
jgi:hypothetical protein